MSSHLIAPEDETFPGRIRWTREECTQLTRDGFLKGRYELIDGEIISKMGQNPPHRLCLKLIAHWLFALFGDLFVQTENPISLFADSYNEPEPDVVVTIAPTTAYVMGHPTPPDIVLLVEVSDSTLSFDLNTKALLYARNGIREYWVANVTLRRMHVHRNPTPTGYDEVTVYDAEAMLTTLARPEAPILVSALLPPA